MKPQRVKIITTIPASHADALREAVGAAGAGQLGEYSFCSFTTIGTGRFKPSDQAKPHIGTPGQFETAEEERIEIECRYAIAKTVIAALRAAHPYEEPMIDIIALIDEADL
ncbi:MAG TPA: hypothetical protein VI322_01230 [Candidatus Saccharimonadia bacterium]